MTRLAEVERHIASMTELRDVFGAMRSLAGMRVQEAQRALPGVRRYADAMADAIADALLLLPERTIGGRRGQRRRALLLFTAEHSFVGGFNEMLVASPEAAPSDSDALFVLGSRGGALVAERGRRIDWAGPMATRAASAPAAIREVAAELYRRIARAELSEVQAVFAQTRQAGPAIVVRRTLFPPDYGRFGENRRGKPPLHNLRPQALLEKLLTEYAFALLTEAAIESIASENAARFAAMNSAHDNVAKKLERLGRSARQARQSEITEELLDLATGGEALARRARTSTMPPTPTAPISTDRPSRMISPIETRPESSK